MRVLASDLSGLPLADAARALDDLLCAEAATGFDLETGPPWRVRLVRLPRDGAAEVHVLSIVTHHALTDGWSLGILGGELGALYAARTKGEPAGLARVAVQPLDHARWQRAREGAEAWERDLAWWRARLRDAPALELPLDRPRPPVASSEGESVAFELSVSATAGVRALARTAGATPFVVLYAAVHALLARWAGADELSLGTPVAGRERPELEGVFGFLVDTVVLRTRAPRTASLRVSSVAAARRCWTPSSTVRCRSSASSRRSRPPATPAATRSSR